MENGKVVKRLLEDAGRVMALNKIVNRAEINKETRFMHGQLHFWNRETDLRGGAGVLQLLLFNRVGGSPVNLQRIFHDVFEKRQLQ